MELKQFNTYKELVSANPENEETKLQRYDMLSKIYNTSYQNQVWIGLILDFLNDNDEEKYYSEYYLTPDRIYGTRKYTYRFISTEREMPCSITDDDIKVLKRFNAQTKFVLYDYQEKPSSDPFAYLENEKKLIDVMQAIGMTDELNNHLCEYCFQKLKKEGHNVIEDIIQQTDKLYTDITSNTRLTELAEGLKRTRKELISLCERDPEQAKELAIEALIRTGVIKSSDDVVKGKAYTKERKKQN